MKDAALNDVERRTPQNASDKKLSDVEVRALRLWNPCGASGGDPIFTSKAKVRRLEALLPKLKPEDQRFVKYVRAQLAEGREAEDVTRLRAAVERIMDGAS